MAGKSTFAAATFRAKTFASGTWAGVGVAVKSISANPSSVPANATTTVAVTGVNTTWLGVGPSFSLSGVAGFSVLSTVVHSDTSATITVQSGAAFGAATLTDATSGASCPLAVLAPAATSTPPRLAAPGWPFMGLPGWNPYQDATHEARFPVRCRASVRLVGAVKPPPHHDYAFPVGVKTSTPLRHGYRDRLAEIRAEEDDLILRGLL